MHNKLVYTRINEHKMYTKGSSESFVNWPKILSH